MSTFSLHWVEPCYAFWANKELEAWNWPVNRRLVRELRFCLCRRVPFAQSSYWLINSYPAPGVQIVESATIHYLKAWNKPISSCFLLSLEQILAETRLNVHDSPFPADAQDTVATFSAPPDRTGKVYGPRPPLPPPPPPPQVLCLPSYRCNKTYWH